LVNITQRGLGSFSGEKRKKRKRDRRQKKKWASTEIGRPSANCWPRISVKEFTSGEGARGTAKEKKQLCFLAERVGEVVLVQGRTITTKRSRMKGRGEESARKKENRKAGRGKMGAGDGTARTAGRNHHRREKNAKIGRNCREGRKRGGTWERKRGT